MNLARNIEETARIIAIVLVFWMFPGMAVQAADDYLSLLEAEAGDTGDRSGVSVAPVSSKQPVKQARGNVVMSGLDFDAFEAELGSNYSGSNFLYVKLSNSKRQRVYSSYRKNNRISAIRKEIVRLLSPG